MDYSEINRLVYLAVETLAPIATARVSMFALNDHTAHPPFFRLRFKDKAKDDPIYKDLKNTIENFNGNLKWILYTRDSTENYLIMPCFIEGEDGISNDKAHYISVLGEKGYLSKIEKAIEDIPRLAEKIKVRKIL